MADLDELRITFFQECEDLLERLGDGLRELAGAPGDGQEELVHSVFRAVHSIKGGAGAFGLGDLVGFAHLFETVLDNLRSGRMEATPPLMETLLHAGDMLDDLVQAARDDVPVPADRLARVTAELESFADGTEDDPLEDFAFEPVLLEVDDGGASPGPAVQAAFAVRLLPHGGMYLTGNEPAALIRALGTLGDVTVTALTDDVFPLEGFDSTTPGLGWHIHLLTDCDEREIADVFDFVEGIADIHITALPAAPDSPDPGGMPVESTADGSSDDAEGAQAPPDPPPQAVARSGGPPTGTGKGTVVPMQAPATVRVNLDRVDRLVNLVGELVIMEAVLSRIIADAGLATNSDAASGLDRIRQLADEIQESVMAIRAQPLRPVFQRMERILREACAATGKSARLITEGSETEVDKTVIERLVDPLTHMIRNSIDHGLEDAAARAAAGKPAEGVIRLSAAHRSGRVLIEIGDDGGGIDRARIRGIAEEKGLVAPDVVLTAAETDAILFMPGFSSKSEVSSVSGRGVGLDVVQREIQALGGRVTISSQEGEGTTFTIALPLTLAVLDGMLVEFGGQTMVLPLASVSETLAPRGAAIHRTGSSGQMVANRGQLIPVVDLAGRFGLQSTGAGPGVLVVVESDTGAQAALAADRILDQRQVVIKSLEENYGHVACISAATILGDGRISLIIDPEEIIRSARPGGGMTALAGGAA